MPYPDKKNSRVYIALGSNLEDPFKQIQSAFEEIKKLPETNFLKCSSLYKSKPVGLLNQPDYINAVAEVDTTLTPIELLNKLLKIELQHGRVRTFRNAPRTLDLDILLYGNLQFSDDRLTVPHPRMTQRAFVLLPLMEIAPHCEIPEHGKISQLITACSNQKIEQLIIS